MLSHFEGTPSVFPQGQELVRNRPEVKKTEDGEYHLEESLGIYTLLTRSPQLISEDSFLCVINLKGQHA
jgi:hypothetical protein